MNIQFHLSMLLYWEYDVSVKDPSTKSSANLKLKVNENSADIVHVQLDTFVLHAGL